FLLGLARRWYVDALAGSLLAIGVGILAPACTGRCLPEVYGFLLLTLFAGAVIRSAVDGALRAGGAAVVVAVLFAIGALSTSVNILAFPRAELTFAPRCLLSSVAAAYLLFLTML